MTRRKSSSARHPIQGCQLQRRRVHQDKIPSPSAVDLIEAVIDTINIVRDRSHVQATIRQEGPSSQIIRPNPHRIDGIVGPAVRVQRIGMRGRIDVLGVCDEGVDFVDHVGVWPVYASEVAEDDLVRADGSADGVVVELCACVDRHPAVPGYAPSGSTGAFRE